MKSFFRIAEKITKNNTIFISNRVAVGITLHIFGVVEMLGRLLIFFLAVAITKGRPLKLTLVHGGCLLSKFITKPATRLARPCLIRTAQTTATQTIFQTDKHSRAFSSGLPETDVRICHKSVQIALPGSQFKMTEIKN